MSWTPSAQEINSVVTVAAPKRYEYLVKKVVDQETVWSLCEHGSWALAEVPNGRHAIPIWPHDEFARTCANGLWAGYEPRAIELDVWLNRWIPGIQKDNRLVAVFPTADDKGVCVEPSKFDLDLRQELENYE